MDTAKILIVEDELLIAAILSKKLEKLGYEVVGTAASGQEALMAITKMSPDVVLMDIIIQGDRDGIETAQQVRDRFGIPIIFITAYSDDATLDRVEQSGAYGFILKPFKDREIHAAIKLALRRSKQHKELEEKSMRDNLTGLYNRYYFESVLHQERLRAERYDTFLSLLMIDIDCFKGFNDTYGHDAGDYVLQEVSALLQAKVRKADVVCRYGGEEMIVLLPACDQEKARCLAEQIRLSCRQLQLVYDNHTLGQVTVSIGVATLSQTNISDKAFLKAADEALYRAKAAGRDRVVVAPDVVVSKAI